MTFLSKTLVPVLAVAALAGCAPMAPPAAAADGSRQCFFTRQANGFAAVSERLVNVRVGVNEVWQLELAGTCLDIDWASRIALTSRGSSTICEGYDALIIAPSPVGGPQRCLVRNVRKLTEAEIAALPKGGRP